MKIKFFTAAILIATAGLQSCINSLNCQDGKGEVTEKVIQINDFDKIHLKNSIDITLIQSEVQEVVVKGNPNLIELLNTEIEDGTWDIKFDKCIDHSDDFTIQISSPNLKEIGIYGSGSVSTKESVLSGNALKIAVYGSGDVNLNCEFEKIVTSIKGSGDIVLKGGATTFLIDVAGSGDIEAGELATNSTSIDIKGSGNVTVNANQSLNVEIKGSGDVYYFGDPPEIKTDIKGSGNVSKK